MARVALVTGGTRGIGAAISLALKAQGRTVVANYASNDAAAEPFKAETGIAVREIQRLQTTKNAKRASQRSSPSTGRSKSW